jgi:hypothetical protein
VRVVECVGETYDTQEVEFGKIYHWCPECVVVECKCGKGKTLTRSDLIKIKPDGKCGVGHTLSV